MKTTILTLLLAIIVTASCQSKHDRLQKKFDSLVSVCNTDASYGQIILRIQNDSIRKLKSDSLNKIWDLHIKQIDVLEKQLDN